MKDNFCLRIAKQLDTLEKELHKTDENNDKSFRKVAKQIIQKHWSKLETRQNIECLGTVIGAGIGSIIQKHQGNYKKGTFAKTYNRQNPRSKFGTTQVQQLEDYIDTADFESVVKLVKITHKYGLKEAYRFVFS